MNRISLVAVPKLSATAICCLGMVLPVMAAPPMSRVQTAVRPTATEGFFGNRTGEKNASAVAAPAMPAHLDLRPPSAGEFAPLMGASAASVRAIEDNKSKHFPSGRGDQDERDGCGTRLGTLGSEAAQAHPLGLAQGIAARFHREGLPVARLWENHSALISLGWNQKGKPGLWLVQKTH